MKKNTQKLLLALFSKDTELKNRVPLNTLQLVVPDLSDGGFRSLLFALKQQGALTTHRLSGVTTVSITHHGTTLLESEFPALSDKWDEWDGKWECLIFMNSPEFDKQFRYLRELLISQGALAINRGVYFSPGGFSDVVMNECKNSYFANVIIFSVGNWKLATETSFLIEKYGLLDVAETYSGLSNDVARLLKSIINENRLIVSYNKDLNLVYDRMAAVLQEDPGFCTFFFKEVENIKNLLLRLNSAISI
jgi:DNA-binding transcriptional regulator PaaX